MSANGHGKLYDFDLERLYVAALIADPSHHGKVAIGLTDLGDPHAYHAFRAFANVRARDAGVTPAKVRAELAATGVVAAVSGLRADPDRGWFDELVALDVPSDAPVAGWAVQLLDLAARRAAAIAAVEEAAREDDEITDFALRDAEPVPTPPHPRPRWCVPLEDFLGDGEPDDDDSGDWIIRDMLPRGEAGIIAGPPKCGKTWSMLDLGIAVALGRPWLGAHDNTMGGPARVLALAFEDGQRRLRKRVWELARAHALTPNDRTLREHLSISREPLSLPGDELSFASELKAWRPALVLIDNLTRVMVGDQNAIKDAKRFSDTWCKLCSDVGAAVVFLHHTSKVGPLKPDQRNQGDPFELIRGSGDLVASARHLVLMRPLESPDDSKLADVRMRGNLDLRREDFVLSFARVRRDERWVAQLTNRGDGEAVRDELAEKRREKQAARKAARGEVTTSNSVDDRVYASIVRLCTSGARDLATYDQLKHGCGVRASEVRPALDRLTHAGRVRAESVVRFEGAGKRKRTVFVPTDESAS